MTDLKDHYWKEDGRVTAGGEDFAKYFHGELTPEQFLANAEVSGNAKELFAVIDPYIRRPIYPRSSDAAVSGKSQTPITDPDAIHAIPYSK